MIKDEARISGNLLNYVLDKTFEIGMSDCKLFSLDFIGQCQYIEEYVKIKSTDCKKIGKKCTLYSSYRRYELLLKTGKGLNCC